MAEERPRTGAASTTTGRRLSATVTRVLALIGVVLGAGAILGMAIGYPIKQLDLGGASAIALDHEALAGSIDPSLAVIGLADLPKGFVTDPNDNGASVHLIGASYCGKTIAPDSPVGDHIARTLLHPGNGWFIQSEAQRLRRTQDAAKFIRESTANLDGCPGGKYFDVNGDKRIEQAIRDDRPDPPVVDYVSRTIAPVNGGGVRIITYFQVGTVVVAVQYAGPANPPKSLMSNAELAILYRLAPEQISKTAKIKGVKPLPDAVTTTVAMGDASPTSSPDPAPTTPTVAPTPTVEPTTTTKQRGSKRSTTTVAAAGTTAKPTVTAKSGK